MAIGEPTFIGTVASVTGGIVRVRLRLDMPSTLIMIEGETYRVGQVGAFYRVPLGYSHLYAVCTQVGADAAPPNLASEIVQPDPEIEARIQAYRWMTIVLFGEALGTKFERGVGQYPTVGDEVHLVTTADLSVVYGSLESSGSITVGSIAASSGIPARLDLARMISRHCSVVGSTGAGKSNLVSVLVEAITEPKAFPSSRVLIVDPHGEYGAALGNLAQVFKLRPDAGKGEKHLWVPYWALPLTDLLQISMGGLQPNIEAAIREMVLELRKEASGKLPNPFPAELLTADSPVPFSIKKLWFDLDDFERQTFTTTGNAQDSKSFTKITVQGDAEKLVSRQYEPADPYNKAPYKNQRKRNIERQLDFMVTRLKDARYKFLFDLGEGLMPDEGGKIKNDVDMLLADWVGSQKPVTVLDVSGVPSDILPTVVGTVLKIVYEALFWAMELPVGGRQQPLLIILEEAHRFLPEGRQSAAQSMLSTVAKEGRKYGVGLLIVTQRPTEIDSTVLSQCGTMIALRTTNSADRGKVSAALPDDLGGLADLLPALRTGEGLFLGEALPIPSRVRIRKAPRKVVGDDPAVVDAWRKTKRPDVKLYTEIVKKWRMQSTSE
jgi:uncharacterized protein